MSLAIEMHIAAPSQSSSVAQVAGRQVPRVIEPMPAWLSKESHEQTSPEGQSVSDSQA
jgi:hypothetical protein